MKLIEGDVLFFLRLRKQADFHSVGKGKLSWHAKLMYQCRIFSLLLRGEVEQNELTGKKNMSYKILIWGVYWANMYE